MNTFMLVGEPLAMKHTVELLSATFEATSATRTLAMTTILMFTSTFTNKTSGGVNGLVHGDIKDTVIQ